ncbi:histidine biosynthesis 2 [Klebsormidium nitens]|uniref:Histidine biosynthesis 2 n=1 Tax=Klebsormidium nitens TaxID=105231 RepID=A0A1Y1IBW0_KLENI|nr:histidine biosynthesis 2 [Klebsormidium nitens]|eukprot:GAQ86909.1 histidine biosynthesis 2 [Klebsormidium nitens]
MLQGRQSVRVQATVDSVPAGRAQPKSTPEVEALLDKLKWDANGLVVAIAQDVDTGAILMQGFSNRDAISATLASKRATFFSRSRKQLWTKGETSSNFIDVTDVYIDCDKDSVIYFGKPDGPTCHTGAETCYFTRLEELGENGAATHSEEHPPTALTTLYSLESTIEQRLAESRADAATRGPPLGKKPSWTRRLLESPELLRSKILEEADELCRSVEDSEGPDRTASEMADVLYHSMVLLTSQGVKFEDVLKVLRQRFAKSGIEEKAGRKAT